MNLIPGDNGLEFKEGECGQETFPGVIFHEQSALMQTHTPHPLHTHVFRGYGQRNTHTHIHTHTLCVSQFHKNCQFFRTRNQL